MGCEGLDERRRSLFLLEQGVWDEDEARLERLRQWQQYPILLEAIRTLRVEALYKSRVHGSGHINRVMILAGLIACEENLKEGPLRQYLAAAAYHDVGRTFDGLELEHGSASALRIKALTGYEGQALLELQGAVAAHSQPDRRMQDIVESYRPQNLSWAMELAALLKDADNLDRVRLGDLKVKYLRYDSAKGLVGFSKRLFLLDQRCKQGEHCCESSLATQET